MGAQRMDAALRALQLPIESGEIAWPGDALFLRARAGGLAAPGALPGLVCEQTYAPEAEALRRAGHAVRAQAEPADPRRHPLVLYLPTRQRIEARAIAAHAVLSTAAGGWVAGAAANDEGARSAEYDLARLVGAVMSRAKHHCRVFWKQVDVATVDRALADEWLAADAPREIDAGGRRFWTRPGVFAWDRVDPASALLASVLPADARGRAADLGAGTGYLAAETLRRCAGLTGMDLYEAERRALDLAARNMAGVVEADRGHIPVTCHWHDVTQGLARRYDLIVCNPPFHAHDRRDRPDLGLRFIAVAIAALAPGGQLWLVANRHLPYETALESGLGSVRTVAQAAGFKVLAGRRTG